MVRVAAKHVPAIKAGERVIWWRSCDTEIVDGMFYRQQCCSPRCAVADKEWWKGA
jgi:hypothetical protein